MGSTLKGVTLKLNVKKGRIGGEIFTGQRESPMCGAGCYVFSSTHIAVVVLM